MDQFPDSLLEQSLQGESLFVPFQRASASVRAMECENGLSGFNGLSNDVQETDGHSLHEVQSDEQSDSLHEGSLDVRVFFCEKLIFFWGKIDIFWGGKISTRVYIATNPSNIFSQKFPTRVYRN